MLTLISPKITVGVHCAKLRTKGMYMNAVVDPDELTFYDPYDNTVYWCIQTMKDIGPDDGLADRQSCCDSSRACYQAI